MSFANELIHAAHRPPVQFRKTPEKIHCRNCGSLLEAYYAEDRLYAVKCYGCDYVAIVKASSPSGAAMFFGDKMGEEVNDENI